MVQVRNLMKVYHTGDTEVYALDGVNLEIGEGEFVAIIGKSGSGKSTLLHLLEGVDRPTDGVVMIQGENIYEKIPPCIVLANHFPNPLFAAYISRYRSNLGFSNAKLRSFSTFSSLSDGGFMTNAYRFRYACIWLRSKPL